MYSPTGTKLTLQLFQDRPLTYKECKNVNELSQLFCNELNQARKELGYREYTVPRLNHMLQHLDLNDRKLLFASALGAKNFSAFFHWAIKVK